MNGIDRFERELPAALSDVAGAGRPDYLNDILGRTARTRQRPAWASLERWLPMELTTPRAATARVPWRAVAVLAALVLLGALALVYAGSQQRRIPPPFGPAANGVIPYSIDGDIYVGDPVSGQSRLVVGGPEEDYSPTFSPDGTRIGFLRGVAQGIEHIVVVNADGTDLHTITSTAFSLISYAQWVPGQNELLVGHRIEGKERLQVFDAAGKAPPRLLLENASVDWALYRPPVGDEILFRGKIDGVWGLYTMRPDGTAIDRLATSAYSQATGNDPDQDLNFPAWSPDGSTIYYNRWDAKAETIQSWVMDADGSNERRFNRTGPDCCWWEGEMVPSPDGKWVLMWRVSPEGESAIYRYPSDGSGNGEVLGPQVAGTAHWLWSPDSTKVLLNYNDDTEGDQTLIDPTTGEVTVLPWHAVTEPDWQRTVK